MFRSFKILDANADLSSGTTYIIIKIHKSWFTNRKSSNYSNTDASVPEADSEILPIAQENKYFLSFRHHS